MFAPLHDTVFRRAGAIIATSPNYLATSPVLAPYRDGCHVVPYGIPARAIREPRTARAVADIAARFGPRLLLAVGRLVYYKGFDVLVRADARLNGRLVIIGEGPLDERLARAGGGRGGVCGEVTFLGEVQNAEVAAVSSPRADVFVLPSVARSEAFGIVQLEAMASGTPVVNTSARSRVSRGCPATT